MSKINQLPERVEQDWEAFRYISGEMNATESQQFESRLELDQSLRESVAEAVELWGGVVLASQPDAQPVASVNLTQPAQETASSSFAIPWFACTGWLIAAILLFALSYSGPAQEEEKTPIAQTPNTARLDHLAEEWHQTRQMNRDANILSSIWTEDGNSELLTSVASTESEETTADDLQALGIATPSWMDSAFADESHDSGGEG